MKKLTRVESNIIQSGLEHYLYKWLEQINDSICRGKRPLFTEEYAKDLINGIQLRVEDLTRTRK
jgi:hypothetical protein